MSRSKVLVVSDDWEACDLYETWLSGDHAVHQAFFGSDGLLDVESLVPDVVLVDLVLEDMTPAEFQAALRRGTAGRGVPVLLVHPGPESPGGLLPGKTIARPFDVETLRVRLGEVLELRKHPAR
jgi:DNA-binding response OmpR family regulator